MKNPDLLINLSRHDLPNSVGNKALNLRRLSDHHFRIPVTLVIPWEAYLRFMEKDEIIIAELRNELENTLKQGKTYALRSSADIEDTINSSYAGQFKTILNVENADQALQAIIAIWSTVRSLQVDQYQEKSSHPHTFPRMAVIVQEMVTPQVSGVAFSRNPMTGADEVIIEAVMGEGLALVDGGVTPQRWVYRKGHWLEQPQEPLLPLERVEVIVNETQKIVSAFQQSVDAEWVFDGQSVFWVQARPITGLEQVNIYSNRIAREMIPGVIKPLIWSINIPLVNTVWVNLMKAMVGHHGIRADELAKSFYYRAYFNMSALGKLFAHIGMPADALEVMMGILPRDEKRSAFKPGWRMMRLLPRLVGFSIRMLNFHQKSALELPVLKKESASFNLSGIPLLSEQQLIQEIDRLFHLTQKIAYYNVVGPLLMAVYNNLFNRQLKKMDILIEGFDMMAGNEDILEYDPNTHLRSLHRALRQFSLKQQQELKLMTELHCADDPDLADFVQQTNLFMQRFGHLSNSGNDFSSIPWREQPQLINDLIFQFSEESINRKELMGFNSLPVRGIRRRFLRFLFLRAQQYRLFREEISSLYTYTYGLFRPSFLSLADHFVRRGWLENREDIFYVAMPDIRQALADEDHLSGSQLRILSHRHQMAIEKVVDFDMPVIIYGEEEPPIVSNQQKKLIGTATSRGYYSGPLRVVKGIEDFYKLKEGDVLAVPYTDVGWTPLFARAGAVVSESGGMLSHSSIIAREYNIPAVLSVQGVTRLKDGTMVTVDGYRGEVILDNQEVEETNADITCA